MERIYLCKDLTLISREVNAEDEAYLVAGDKRATALCACTKPSQLRRKKK